MAICFSWSQVIPLKSEKQKLSFPRYFSLYASFSLSLSLFLFLSSLNFVVSVHQNKWNILKLERNLDFFVCSVSMSLSLSLFFSLSLSSLNFVLSVHQNKWNSLKLERNLDFFCLLCLYVSFSLSFSLSLFFSLSLLWISFFLFINSLKLERNFSDIQKINVFFKKETVNFRGLFPGIFFICLIWYDFIKVTEQFFSLP